MQNKKETVELDHWLDERAVNVDSKVINLLIIHSVRVNKRKGDEFRERSFVAWWETLLALRAGTRHKTLQWPLLPIRFQAVGTLNGVSLREDKSLLCLKFFYIISVI